MATPDIQPQQPESTQSILARLYSALKTERAAIIAAVLLGLIIRVLMYMSNRSLWLDEASLALNIIERSFAQLTAPLDYYQTAPLGFLYVTKAVTLILGEREKALRLFPLLASLAAMVLFPKMAARLAPAGAVSLCTLVFALGPYLIYFAQEFKQYSIDVLATILLSIPALDLVNKPFDKKTVVALFGAGLFCGLFSFGSIFVSTTIAVILSVRAWQKKQWNLLLIGLILLMLSAGFFALQYKLLIENLNPLAHKAYIVDWRLRNGFLRLRLHSQDDWYALMFLVTEPMARLASSTLIGIAVTPIAVITSAIRLSRIHFAFLILPMIFGMFTSAFEVYPWAQRFVLFVQPQSAILVGTMLYTIAAYLWRIHPLVALSLVVLFNFPYYQLNRTVPFDKREEFRSVFRFVKSHYQEGQSIYVYQKAKRPFEYYNIVYKGPTDKVWFGKKWPDPKYIARKTDSKQVWMLFAHMPVGVGPRSVEQKLAKNFKIKERIVDWKSWGFLLEPKDSQSPQRGQ